MKSAAIREITINNKLGLHARPAATFVKTANEFSSVIRIRYGDKVVDAKNVIGLMSLGVPKGGTITLTAEGADAEQALAALEELLQKFVLEDSLICIRLPRVAAPKPIPTAYLKSANGKEKSNRAQ